MGVIRYLGDKLTSLVANLGTTRDKAATTYYSSPCIADDELINAYRGAWLPRKIVDIPALDSCRNWRQWQASKDQITAIEAEENRLNVRGLILETITQARLRGGAALFIGTGDGNPMMPLNPETIRKGGIKHLTVMRKRVLTAGDLETDPMSPLYGKPKFYRVSSQRGSVDIHPSRLVLFTGNPQPDPELATGTDYGWGDSVLLSVMEAIKQADGTSANLASLVFEAKVDVIRIPEFMANLADPEYERTVLERFRLAMVQKGINGTLVLDKEEEYEQKSVTLTGLTDVLMAFLQLVSGAADIPVTRLLGQSPAGMNATGESDIRNYYDRIRSSQELVMMPAMALLDECLIRSALGSRPPEVHYTWNSLWQSTKKEHADIGKVTADTIKVIADTGLIPDQVMAETAANMLIEAGIMPGLEAAIEEYGLEADAEEDAAAAAGVDPAEDPEDDASKAMTDAKPRTLYVHRKVLNHAAITAWAKDQGFESTLPGEDMHVTIAFSKQPLDWMKAGSDWAGDGDNGGLLVQPGGARIVEQFDGGAVVLLFNSSRLSWRHEAIKEAGASWDWPEYQPHITITYKAGAVDLSKVEPYRGAIELGPEVFEELDTDWRAKVSEVEA